MDYNQKCAARAASTTPLTPEALGPVRDQLGDIFPPRSIRFDATFQTGWARAQSRNGAGATAVYTTYFVGRRFQARHPSLGRRHGYTDRRLGLLGLSHMAWHALHGGRRPNLRRHRFFAKALLRVPESEARPRAGASSPPTVGYAMPRTLPVVVMFSHCRLRRHRRGGASTASSLRHLCRAVVLVADEPRVARGVSGTASSGVQGGGHNNQHWRIAAWMERLMPRSAEEEAAIPSLRQASAMLTEGSRGRQEPLYMRGGAADVGQTRQHLEDRTVLTHGCASLIHYSWPLRVALRAVDLYTDIDAANAPPITIRSLYHGRVQFVLF
ncbi:hypothetical protein F5X96DRAFT_670644 [Biscogniauxia mediterranea]|nr:hypothetical protein F5X96DRAFT_670644 [Biscogniauxia mediterranea]